VEIAELIQADDDLFNKVNFHSNYIFVNGRVTIVYYNHGYCYPLFIVFETYSENRSM